MSNQDYDGWYDDVPNEEEIDEDELSQAHIEISPYEIIKFNNSLKYFLKNNGKLIPIQHNSFESNLDELCKNLSLLEKDNGYYKDEILQLKEALKLLAQIVNSVPTIFRVKLMKCQNLIRKYLAKANAYTPEIEEQYYNLSKVTANSYAGKSKQEIYEQLKEEETLKLIDKVNQTDLDEIRELAARDAEMQIFSRNTVKRSLNSDEVLNDAARELYDSLFSKTDEEKLRLQEQAQAKNSNITMEELNQNSLDAILSKASDLLVKSYRKK
jgi:hypothetical protein